MSDNTDFKKLKFRLVVSLSHNLIFVHFVTYFIDKYLQKRKDDTCFYNFPSVTLHEIVCKGK
ncbi:hypothetical protein HMPREF0649_01621 [Segatella buccae D17]|nr:hypothetical protein HMPREF0649_01621 [Segatella buccae D17]